jgi:hypothetical protein
MVKRPAWFNARVREDEEAIQILDAAILLIDAYERLYLYLDHRPHCGGSECTCGLVQALHGARIASRRIQAAKPRVQ